MLERSAEKRVVSHENIEDDDLTFHALHDPVAAVCSPDKESSLGVLHSLGLLQPQIFRKYSLYKCPT